MNLHKRLYKYIGAVALAVLMVGCGLSSNSDSAYRHVFIEEEARLADTDNSPYCDFAIDFTYLDEVDSVAVRMNRNIQREFLGDDYATLDPVAAVDSFRNTYLADYRNEVGAIFEKERANASSEDEIPAWFSQTYSLVTFVEEGQSGVVNATANYFVDMGGAHPHQWSIWLNFDFVTGRILEKEDVFHLEASADIEALLLDKLIRMQAEEHPDMQVNSLEDLQNMGFLQHTNMFIPDNFLLSKRGMLFLFNRYDIAPYSAGEIVIEVPYGEIGHYLKNN
ncbi:MAG: DUF3298 domain-containing protein [Bacteroidaceae bacterium]|nr:DUF3298 domain-containing protein [Bacteroidaceae bacterium]